MRVRCFLLGVLVGLLLAPAGSRELWRRLRDTLAAAIDAGLSVAASRSGSAGAHDAL
jgi:hypothetical protein